MLAGAVVRSHWKAESDAQFRLEHLLNAPAKTLAASRNALKHLTDVLTDGTPSGFSTISVPHPPCTAYLQPAGRSFETTPCLPVTTSHLVLF